jgi:hypothetical protein
MVGPINISTADCFTPRMLLALFPSFVHSRLTANENWPMWMRAFTLATKHPSLCDTSESAADPTDSGCSLKGVTTMATSGAALASCLRSTPTHIDRPATPRQAITRSAVTLT